MFDCSETGCLPACWCVCSIGQRHQTLNHQFLIFSYRRAFFFPFYYYCRARRIIKAVDRVLSCLSEPSTHRWFVMYKVGNHFSAQFVFYARSSSSFIFVQINITFYFPRFSRGNNISLTPWRSQMCRRWPAAALHQSKRCWMYNMKSIGWWRAEKWETLWLSNVHTHTLLVFL